VSSTALEVEYRTTLWGTGGTLAQLEFTQPRIFSWAY